MWAKIRDGVWEVVKFLALTVIIVIPIRTFVAQPFIVSGLSMYPTYHDKEYLIVDELSYYRRAPERGEVVVFRYPQDPSKHFIKRIIGLPGEKVMIADGQVRIETSSETLTLTEPYLNAPTRGESEVKLGPTDYFVMGDNRNVSLDSRAWGPLPRRFITGRALFRLFPLNRLAIL